MATYEEIRAANATIEPTDIKGKKYASVNQRIKAFRMVYPDGAIITEKTKDDGGRCEFVAKVYSHYPDEMIGTGTAYEIEGGSNINKTSYIENCETSAVGRALGMCGFGVETDVASANEVTSAHHQMVIAMYEEAINEYGPKCSECGKVIFPIFKGRDGEPWAISQIVTYSERRFSRVLCPDCQKAAIKAGD